MKARRFYKIVVIFLVLTLYCIEIAYSWDSRYTKIDSSGNELSNDAEEWAITYDTATRLYWEVKSTDESIHSKSNVYSYSKAKKDVIATLNETQFGGFSDWRLPTLEELMKLKETRDEEPYINIDAFPNTIPSEYVSWELCGNGEISPKKVVFGKQKPKKRNFYVRAVRGASPDGFDRY